MCEWGRRSHRHAAAYLCLAIPLSPQPVPGPSIPDFACYFRALHHYLCGYASTIPSDEQHYTTIAAFIRSNNTWALPLELRCNRPTFRWNFPRSRAGALN